MWWRVPRRGNSTHLKLKSRENSKYPIRELTGVRGQARLLNEDILWLNNSTSRNLSLGDNQTNVHSSIAYDNKILDI